MRYRLLLTLTAGVILGLLSARSTWADDQPPPHRRGDNPDAAPAPPDGLPVERRRTREEGGPAKRSHRGEAGERDDDWGGPSGPGRRPGARPPRGGDADRADDAPPPKPPRRGEFGDPDDGLPPKPPREGQVGGPDDGPMMPRPARDGQFGGPGGGQRPPFPPGDGRGPGGGPDRPLGPPRPRPEDLESLKKNDPEMFKLVEADQDLEHKTFELARQYRQAPADRREALKKEIKEIVGKHFDVRQDRRALELKRAEAEIQHVRESLERRNAGRAQIVERRISELVGRDDDLGF